MEEQKSYFTVGSIIGETVNFYTDNFLKLWLPFILIQFPAEKVIGYFSTGSLNPFVYILIFLNYFLSTAVTLYVIIAALNLYKKSSSLFQDNFSGLKKDLYPLYTAAAACNTRYYRRISAPYSPGDYFDVEMVNFRIIINRKKNKNKRIHEKEVRFLQKALRARYL